MTVAVQPPRNFQQPPPHHVPPVPPLPQGLHTLANYGPPPVLPEYVATADLSPASRRIFTPSVALWSVLGLLAAGYLGYLAVNPAQPGIASSAEPAGASHLAGDLSGIKDSIANVQLEIARLKTDLAGQDVRGKMMSDQLAQLERKISTSAGVDTSLQSPGLTNPPGDRGAAAADAGATAALATPGKPRLVNGSQQVSASDLGLETGSVAAPAKPVNPVKTIAAAQPIDFGTAVVKPAAKPVGVQISSGASVDSLRLSWSLLSDRHADSLRNLQPRYTAHGDESAPTFDLIAGPIKSRAEAMKICKALAAKSVPCKIGDYLGEAL